jgi:hypothetical protein
MSILLFLQLLIMDFVSNLISFIYTLTCFAGFGCSPGSFSKGADTPTNPVQTSTSSDSLDTGKQRVILRIVCKGFSDPGSKPWGVLIEQVSHVFRLGAARHKVSNTTFCTNLSSFAYKIKATTGV